MLVALLLKAACGYVQSDVLPSKPPSRAAPNPTRSNLLVQARHTCTKQLGATPRVDLPSKGLPAVHTDTAPLPPGLPSPPEHFCHTKTVRRHQPPLFGTHVWTSWRCAKSASAASQPSALCRRWRSGRRTSTSPPTAATCTATTSCRRGRVHCTTAESIRRVTTAKVETRRWTRRARRWCWWGLSGGRGWMRARTCAAGSYGTARGRCAITCDER